MIGLPRTIESRRAARVLRRVFERIPTGFAFRLWDGTLVELGHGAPVCTAVIREPAHVHPPHARSQPAQLRRSLRRRRPRYRGRPVCRHESRRLHGRDPAVDSADRLRSSYLSGEADVAAACDVIVVGGGPGREHRGLAPGPRGSAARRARCGDIPAREDLRGLGDPRGAGRRRGRSRRSTRCTIQAVHGVPVRLRGQAPRDTLAPAGQLRHRSQRVRPLPPGPRPRRRRRRARGGPRDGGDARRRRDPRRERAGRVRRHRSSSAREATAAPSPRHSASCPSAKRSSSRRRARRGCRPIASRRSRTLRDRARALRRARPQGLWLVLSQGRRAQHRHRRRLRPGRGPADAAGTRSSRHSAPRAICRPTCRSSLFAATPTSCAGGRRGASPGPASASSATRRAWRVT